MQVYELSSTITETLPLECTVDSFHLSAHTFEFPLTDLTLEVCGFI